MNGIHKIGSEGGGTVALTVPTTATNTTATLQAKDGTVALIDNVKGFKNYIINGGFDIWQRGTSQTTNGYGSCDRWFANFDGNFTVSHEVIEYQNTARLSWTSAGTYKNFVTSVEDGARKLQNKTLTLSFMAKASTAGVCFTYIGRGQGVGISAGIDSVTINLTTSWQKFTRTFTVPTYDNINMTLVVGLSSMQLLGSSNTVWIKDVQLEEGSVATPFENRPIGLELSLCQRYFQRFRIRGRATSGYCSFGRTLQTTMRTAPSLSNRYFYTNETTSITDYSVFSTDTEITLNWTVTGTSIPYIDVSHDLSAEL